MIATFAAKAAVLLTIEKLLAREMTERKIFKYTLATVGLLGLASLLTVTIDCDGRTCNQVSTKIKAFRSLLVLTSSQQPRWIAVAVMDSASEIWGFSLFCKIIFSLQMKLAFKLTSTAILGLRML